MSDRGLDAFTSVIGARRGTVEGRLPDREPTDLDRARELQPLVGAALAGEHIMDSAIALRRRAHQLGIEVVHGVFSSGEYSDVESPLTLLMSVTGALIGVIGLDYDGCPLLLRPDQPRLA